MFVGTFIGPKLAKVWNWSVKHRAPCFKCHKECGQQDLLVNHLRKVHGLNAVLEGGLCVVKAPQAGGES